MRTEIYEFVADGECEILKEFFSNVREATDFDRSTGNDVHFEGVLGGILDLIEDTESQLSRIREVRCD